MSDYSNELRKLEEVEIGRDTSDLIIGITQVFNSEQSYDAAMNGVLERISHVLNPDRLIVFERGEETTSCIFEWCAEGVPSQKHRMQNMPNARFDSMGQLAKNKRMVVSEIDDIKDVSNRAYHQMDQAGVNRMMAVPLRHKGNTLGYLSANNFRLEESLDAKRVLDTVASFISARMVNQHLVEELEQAGVYDKLTGLLNRWGLDSEITNRLGDDTEEHYVLALVDVDDFKLVNDRHGHDVGDAALVALAQSIQQAFPESAIIGRNGGDEFLIMLIGADADEAEELTERFAAQKLGCDFNGQHYPLSASIGYAAFPSQATDLLDAYSKADAALYAVKLAGKSGVARYSSKLDPKYRSQLGFTARDIAENIPGAIVVYRATDESEILFANDELVALIGCDDYTDFMSFTGGTFAGIVHPDDRGLVLEGNARQAHPAGAIGRGIVEYRIATKSGGAKPIADISRLTEIAKVGTVYYTLIVDGD